MITFLDRWILLLQILYHLLNGHLLGVLLLWSLLACICGFCHSYLCKRLPNIDTWATKFENYSTGLEEESDKYDLNLLFTYNLYLSFASRCIYFHVVFVCFILSLYVCVAAREGNKIWTWHLPHEVYFLAEWTFLRDVVLELHFLIIQ